MVTIEDTTDITQAFRDAAFASLQGSAKSKAALALVRAACTQVARHEHVNGTHQHKPGAAVEEAVGAFLADLLVAQSDESPSEWVHRALHAQGFSGGPVGHRVFIRVLSALKGLKLVEHEDGMTEFS